MTSSQLVRATLPIAMLALLFSADPASSVTIAPEIHLPDGMIMTGMGFRRAEDCSEVMRLGRWRDGHYWSAHPELNCNDEPYSGKLAIISDEFGTDIMTEDFWSGYGESVPHDLSAAGRPLIAGLYLPRANGSQGPAPTSDTPFVSHPRTRPFTPPPQVPGMNLPPGNSDVRPSAAPAENVQPPEAPSPVPVPPGILLLASALALALAGLRRYAN